MFTAEIIAAGNELLTGGVLDTNTHWLCRRLTEIGGRVGRAVLVGDSVEAIAGEVRAALTRRVDLVVTAGGLGPTADDLTLAAVAAAAGLPLESHPEALDFVCRRYAEQVRLGYVGGTLATPARQKMAALPATAAVLGNPRGVAPAVLLHAGASQIVCLPGVPAELEAIFDEILSPLLLSIFEGEAFLRAEVAVGTGDESELAPILAAVASDHPEVYLKSLADRFGPDVRLKVQLSAAGGTPAAARERLDRALGHLESALVAARLTMARLDGRN